MFKFFKKTKEKAEKAIADTKDKVTKLAESANKFISDGNNQMKTITVVVLSVGVSLILSNIVNVGTSIYTVKNMKEPKVINNIYYGFEKYERYK